MENNSNLKEAVNHLMKALILQSNKLNDLKQEFRQNHYQIMTAIDGLAKFIADGQTAKAMVNHALLRYDHQLEVHETRIGVLEETLSSTQ